MRNARTSPASDHSVIFFQDFFFGGGVDAEVCGVIGCGAALSDNTGVDGFADATGRGA